MKGCLCIKIVHNNVTKTSICVLQQETEIEWTNFHSCSYGREKCFYNLAYVCPSADFKHYFFTLNLKLKKVSTKDKTGNYLINPIIIIQCRKLREIFKNKIVTWQNSHPENLTYKKSSILGRENVSYVVHSLKINTSNRHSLFYIKCFTNWHIPQEYWYWSS